MKGVFPKMSKMLIHNGIGPGVGAFACVCVCIVVGNPWPKSEYYACGQRIE